MNRSNAYLALFACAASSAVLAQSTGGFSPSSSGSAAAGGSPVGMVLPWTVQTGSTAPTLPGHAITGARASGDPKAPAARAPARTESAGARPLPDTTNRQLSRNDVQGFNGISFEDTASPSSREDVASAAAAKPAQP